MSFRTMQSLRAVAVQVTRQFSSSSVASTSKLSPLNKTSIARQQRLARGTAGSKGARSSKDSTTDTMSLQEAAKVLQVSRSLTAPSSSPSPAAAPSSLLTFPWATPHAGVVNRHPQRSLRNQHYHQTLCHDPTQRPPRSRLPPPLLRLVHQIFPPSRLRSRSRGRSSPRSRRRYRRRRGID